VIADVLDLSLVCSTQKILHHARLAERGVIARDPMKEAIGLELDMINILYILLHLLAFDLTNCTTFFSVFVLFRFSLCKATEGSKSRYSLEPSKVIPVYGLSLRASIIFPVGIALELDCLPSSCQGV
jgi:hypothetical protein